LHSQATEGIWAHRARIKSKCMRVFFMKISKRIAFIDIRKPCPESFVAC
jgi:hypothetical protein